MAVILIGTVTPKPDQLEAVETILRSMVPAIHDEDGCEFYALHRAKDRLVFVEKWRDRDALVAHGGGPNIAAMNEKLGGLTAGRPDIVYLEALPAGDPEKGTL